MSKWLYKSNVDSKLERYLRFGRAWTDDYGVQHPSNWGTWTLEEKAARGITEIPETTPPDGKFYNYSQNKDGTYISIPKDIDDKLIAGTGGTPDYVQKGVRSQLIEEVKQQQRSLLAQTDWTIIRKQDINTPVSAEVIKYRNDIRTKSAEMRTAIAAAVSILDIEELFVKHTSNPDGTITKTGVLYDWPVAPDGVL